jgi:hypothetical protein
MSYGPFRPSAKYAPGLDSKTTGQIQRILHGWKKLGIGQEQKRGR